MGLVTKKKGGRKVKKAARKRSPKYSDLPNLSNDPYFVEKTEKAKKLIEKYGAPKF